MLTVAELFKEFKSNLELGKTLQESITTHHNAVRKWVEDYDSSIKTKLIGSLQRNTRICPVAGQQFDIDILVVLGNFYNWVSSGGISPRDALSKVEGIVEENDTYEQMGPESDSPAIVFNYSDNIKVELIPAYVDMIGHTSDGISVPPSGRGYWTPQKGKWVIADYDYDANYISVVNSSCDGWLIPVIKMLKSSKRIHFSYLSSYHLEILAVRIIPLVVARWKEKNIAFSYPDLLYAFFALASDETIKELRIPNSKCSSNSSYLDPIHQLLLSEKMSELSGKAKEALSKDDASAMKIWQEILGKPFPSGARSWMINELRSL